MAFGALRLVGYRQHVRLLLLRRYLRDSPQRLCAPGWTFNYLIFRLRLLCFLSSYRTAYQTFATGWYNILLQGEHDEVRGEIDKQTTMYYSYIRTLFTIFLCICTPSRMHSWFLFHHFQQSLHCNNNYLFSCIVFNMSKFNGSFYVLGIFIYYCFRHTLCSLFKLLIYLIYICK